MPGPTKPHHKRQRWCARWTGSALHEMEGEDGTLPVEVLGNQGDGAIEVRSYGVVTSEELTGVLAPIELLARETEINKVLVDTSGEERLPSILELDDFAVAIPSSLQVALVITEEQPTAERAGFVRHAAYNVGAHIEAFHSRADALKWLNE